MLSNTQWVANVRWVAGVVTAVGVVLIASSIADMGAPLSNSAFFVLETGVGQFAVVSSALVWAVLVIHDEIAIIRRSIAPISTESVEV